MMVAEAMGYLLLTSSLAKVLVVDQPSIPRVHECSFSVALDLYTPIYPYSIIRSGIIR